MTDSGRMLTKIRRGAYRHEPSGNVVVRTDGWGEWGNRSFWEIGSQDADGSICLDRCELFRTRRDAIAAIDARERGA